MTTHIRGIDFTSAPKASKPITLAEGELEGDVLRIERLRSLVSFDELRAALCEQGPWVAGLDFPFGQPRRLIANLRLPETWRGYVGLVSEMGSCAFESVLKMYTCERAAKDKEHKRRVDVLAKSVSPMHLANPPVGKMFFQGAPLILASNAAVVPCAASPVSVSRESARVLLEGYPALVVRALAGDRFKYKDQQGLDWARRHIVDQLAGSACRERYGLAVSIETLAVERVISDRKGDLLDAVLCAVQAAWASRQPRYGIPTDCDPLEGWIVDPALLP